MCKMYDDCNTDHRRWLKNVSHYRGQQFKTKYGSEPTGQDKSEISSNSFFTVENSINNSLKFKKDTQLQKRHEITLI